MKAVPAAVGEEGSVMDAAIVEEGPVMKASSNNKRKTEAVPAAVVEEEEEGSMLEAAIGEEACAKKRKDDPSTGSKAEVEAAGKVAAAANAVPVDGDGLARAENGMWILPDEEVQLVLNIPIYDEVPLLLQESLREHKAWVREQYEANNGVVLLDDEMVARRVESRKEMAKGFTEMLRDLDLSEGVPISQWKFSDRHSDFFDSDEEEGEEVVQPEPIKNN